MQQLIQNFEAGNRSVVVTWADAVSGDFPWIWLRDNDVAELHPTTQERTFDLTSVPIDIKPDNVALADNALLIRWPGRDDISRYDADWLYQHRPGIRRPDAAIVPQTLWTKDSMQELPRFDAGRCRASSDVLSDALRTVKSVGLVLFVNLPDDPDAGVSFGDIIGFKRETNFGVTFDVVSKPDANNLAYTAQALPLHVDLPNQELVPGFQFLHCIRHDATGGRSIFADGYQICADLRQQHPDHFELLTRKRIPLRFHDDSCDIRQRRPVISQARNGDFTQVVFNAHIADVPDMPTRELYAFYEAYQVFMKLARSQSYRIEYLLRAGEMVMFDNRRVMHGRTAFDPSSGRRQLRGYYIDRNEVDSRMRILARRQ